MMVKLDEVSEALGRLEANTVMILRNDEEIKNHLKELNGTVTKHQIKMAGCDQRFNDMAKVLGSVKWDYKFWGAIAGLTVIVTAAMRLLGY